jgi:chromosome segregation ATPase
MFLSGYPALTDGIRQRLFAWRRRVEEEFPLSDRRRLTESQKRILKEALGEAEQTLLESLRRGIDELKADRDAVIARRAAIAAEMEKAQRALTEAKADLEQAFAWAG